MQEVKQAMMTCDVCGKERNPAVEGPFHKSNWERVRTRYGSLRTVCGVCYVGMYKG